MFHFPGDDIVRVTGDLIRHDVNIGELVLQHGLQIQIHSAADILDLDLNLFIRFLVFTV